MIEWDLYVCDGPWTWPADIEIPVCNGTGRYMGKTCHGCNGKGWVEVHEDPKPEPYDKWVRWHMPNDQTWPAEFEYCRRGNYIRCVKL